ncbi:aldehyde dehydrogenase [Romboutsia sp. 1001216sp1]|uniref:aldehyde dehydrogenase n=1 Tax=unclassified Romboutsia TaxID=2626894 RepID=UPI0018AC6982|nr:aldehyde dehydrogenase [Romboutsia sp. 1001216sp1]MDB8794251.1 aldehyde dehydrogenase [Romboutsia sp. 1001216sp1]MDB8796420.1 aldehyde dehydrogenase [Romboutsia sp. 1001216sp1]MDB8797827.1 aldehyde dehydrogenase [Romboutsia sp. 1001216sp1]
MYVNSQKRDERLIKDILNNQRLYFESNKTKDINFRLDKLKTLKKAIVENEEAILNALYKDLGKSHFEGYETEIGIVLEEINYAIKHLKSWSKNKKVSTPITQFPAKSYIVSEPYGVVLIMAPWNYPFQLTISPLIGAIAGGNCSILKPSEFSVHTSKVIVDIINKYFERGYINVIEGGIGVNQQILEERFDYIFFTGSVNVGKIVMNKASKYLTPVTLELGGKSPCIVEKSANVDLSAKRIVWGKFLNAGQTCVAPDYIIVHKDIKKDLIDNMKKYIIKFYGNNPIESVDYPKIINKTHFDRLNNLMKNTDVIIGGNIDKSKLKIAPTIIDNIDHTYPIMDEEIFGPLLPIITYEDYKDIIEIVKKHPNPLALYLFTKNKDIEKYITNNIAFGGGCINDTIIHLATSNLPFGGRGTSGMGSYHGKKSFDTFTHKKSILKKSNLIDIPVRYAPYKGKLKLLKKILK